MTDLTPVPAPDTVTETIRADQLTPGRTVHMPMTGELETLTSTRTRHGYVSVWTDKTGPTSAYHWPASDLIDVVLADASRD